MPLHARRRRTRGYNQSERIARTMARHSGVPLIATAKRIRHTKPLTVSRSAAERTAIIAGAFTAVNADAFYGKSVLIVDDVLTTGTTVNELARVLREAGAQKVNALTIARAD
ncbi:MAG: ComF family protein [Spirochaetes bacterium]|nr:ComF family protein [Spirochaetota bacterium]